MEDKKIIITLEEYKKIISEIADLKSQINTMKATTPKDISDYENKLWESIYCADDITDRIYSFGQQYYSVFISEILTRLNDNVWFKTYKYNKIFKELKDKLSTMSNQYIDPRIAEYHKVRFELDEYTQANKRFSK